MDNYGWIFLHKCLLEWEWYKDINTKCLFIHCLLKANYSDKEWRGKLIKRGQFFTSIENLSNELSMSIKQIRNCLKKLEKTQELGIQGASNGTMITVCKYEDYQNIDIIKGQAKGQTKGKQRANKGQQLNKKEIIITKKENDSHIFYQNEIDRNKDCEFIKEYKMFYGILSGNNGVDEILTNVLSIEQQVSYKQFVKLFNKSKERGKKFSNMLITMDNNIDYCKKRTSLSKTLHTWLNNEFR